MVNSSTVFLFFLLPTRDRIDENDLRGELDSIEGRLGIPSLMMGGMMGEGEKKGMRKESLRYPSPN